jgi:hypothetical protein
MRSFVPALAVLLFIGLLFFMGVFDPLMEVKESSSLSTRIREALK